MLPRSRTAGLSACVGLLERVLEISRPEFSEMVKDLDEHVIDLRTRPLDAGPYTFVAADALTMKL